jgi:Protein of unknown function (DUF2971)
MSYLRRYTDVLSLLDIIKNNRITLLSPETWFDQNDTFGLREYAKRMGDGSAYALCMTEEAETGHHWQLFAGTSHGVCIQFDRDEFIEFLNGLKRPILHGSVRYMSLNDIRNIKPIETEILPFLKRETFKDENEYRLIAWEDDFLDEGSYSIPMPANLIKKIILGPRMPRKLAETLKDIACSFDGCDEISFAVSRVHNNASWRKAILEGLGSQ